MNILKHKWKKQASNVLCWLTFSYKDFTEHKYTKTKFSNKEYNSKLTIYLQ